MSQVYVIVDDLSDTGEANSITMVVNGEPVETIAVEDTAK